MTHFFSKNILYSRFFIDDYIHEGKIEDDWQFIELLDGEVCENELEDFDMDDQEDTGSLFSFEVENKIEYTVLSKADIRKCLEDDITKVCEVLLLTREEAEILLRHCKWAVNEASDKWTSSEEKACLEVGLFVKPVVETPADATEITCTVCGENKSRDVMHSVSCGHQICRPCWKGYISEAISNGPQCLTLRCRAPFCNAAVGPNLMEQLSSEEDKKKFEDHLLRSYLLGRNKKVIWCPSSTCDCAIICSADEGKVTCHCMQTFCLKCSLEGHTPVDCATADAWMREVDHQSQNWIYANTTKLPNCKYQYEIAESQYSAFTQCTACPHSFCRACGDNIGSFRPCVIDAESERKAIIKKSVKRYNRYREAWTTCESSRKNTLEDLKVFKELQQNLNSDVIGVGVEALEQVVDCWQFLKWIHVYGYFVLPEDQSAKRNFLEFEQEDATDLVGKLQYQANEYKNFLYKDIQPLKFLQLRDKLIKSTSNIRRYFVRMEEDISDGLSKVVFIPRPTLKLEASKGEDNLSQKIRIASLSLSPTYIITGQEGDISTSRSIGSMNIDDIVKSDPEIQSTKDEE